LIRDCTTGAPEWKGRRRNLFRQGNTLYSSSKFVGVKEGSAEETQMAAKEWWGEEVRLASAFLEGRTREEKICGDVYDEVMKSASQRPKLKDVLHILEETETLIMGSKEETK